MIYFAIQCAILYELISSSRSSIVKAPLLNVLNFPDAVGAGLLCYFCASVEGRH